MSRDHDCDDHAMAVLLLLLLFLISLPRFSADRSALVVFLVPSLLLPHLVPVDLLLFVCFLILVCLE